ncbi:TetR/AcrR family transcriptional regulator [Gordonia sp. LSe1-13]|uniref:TetR/AcrR family transcriptional regulator n=1 Tax=Gordonia sesuvii TaxID=3116777 RepID=A0ABU7MJQ8_9ACTN|nr:TetR/AcrR family transcriptional regulator [Gordonia sp. LSe1-13]MEE3852801.1 TetR/AcrR family transcriptional regulator [Gordonia sp. LSe1-13]
MVPDTVTVSPDVGSPVRGRLLEAMATCVMERGYRDTTVADVVRVARTSRRSFYQEFDDKQACFVELLRSTNDAMIAAISENVDPDADWTVQIRQAVEAYVEVTEQNPEIAWSWIRELPALGESARRIQVDAMESLIAVLVPLTDTPRMRESGIAPMTHETAVMIWGGIRELAASAVEQKRSLYTIVEPMVGACIALVGANIGR